MLRLKGCPRCRGDIVFERDKYGEFGQCLQCGYLSGRESFLESEEECRTMEKAQQVTR